MCIRDRPSRHHIAVPPPPVELLLPPAKRGGVRSGDVHYYELVATVKNTGPTRVDDWYIEIDFPTCLLPSAPDSRIMRRDTTTALFRQTGNPPILCGDKGSLSISYRMDNDLYFKLHDKLPGLTARARAFVGGAVVATAEQSNLQNF